MYATVEETVYGHATVRLADGGARMTMLPVLTATVEVGEKVVLDYSAEGQPFVRPLTALPTEAGFVSAPSAAEPPEELGLVAARMTRTTPLDFKTFYIVPDQGPGYSIRKVGLDLNKVVWETQEGLCKVDDDGFFDFHAPEDGKYLVRWCVAYEATHDLSAWDSSIMFRVYTIGNFSGMYYNECGGRMARRFVGQTEDGVDIVVVSGSTLVHLTSVAGGYVSNTVGAFVQVETQMPSKYASDPDLPKRGSGCLVERVVIRSSRYIR
jgi:hypothetical protein